MRAWRWPTRCRRVKERADFVTRGDHGAGVVELIERLLADDLRALEAGLARHTISLGAGTTSGKPVYVARYGPACCSPAARAAGKSTLATGFIETLTSAATSSASSIRRATMHDLRSTQCVLGDAEAAARRRRGDGAAARPDAERRGQPAGRAARRPSRFFARCCRGCWSCARTGARTGSWSTRRTTWPRPSASPAASALPPDPRLPVHHGAPRPRRPRAARPASTPP